MIAKQNTGGNDWLARTDHRPDGDVHVINTRAVRLRLPAVAAVCKTDQEIAAFVIGYLVGIGYTGALDRPVEIYRE